jgi:glycosyltransferase involved in cell wall biosynthesis
MTARPSVSAIMPAYNAAATIREALTALCAALHPGDELIVFDDGSTDTTGAIASGAGARVLRNDGPPRGPAHGRNKAAAEAQGELLFFVDADVVIAPDALDRLLDAMITASSSAAFGSYDDQPRSHRSASLYMNLRHHHVHHQGPHDATTFWAGIGLIERRAFECMSGFDAELFATSSIEDVELGMRMAQAGHRILLVPGAQGTHLKDWTLPQVWRTDIVKRALPWSRLISQGKAPGADLNLAYRERVNAGLALAVIPAAALAVVRPQAALVSAAAVAAYVYRNRRFFVFLARRMPLSKLPAGMAMHWCYHVYSSTTFAVVAAAQQISRPRATSAQPKR